MTDTQLQRMAHASAVIRQVVCDEFQWEQPGLREYGKGAVMVLLHPQAIRFGPTVTTTATTTRRSMPSPMRCRCWACTWKTAPGITPVSMR